MGVQLEVVLPAKELLADLALELAAPAMGGDVAAQVSLAGEHLLTHKTKVRASSTQGTSLSLCRRGRCGLHRKHKKLTVTASLERTH